MLDPDADTLLLADVLELIVVTDELAFVVELDEFATLVAVVEFVVDVEPFVITVVFPIVVLLIDVTISISLTVAPLTKISSGPLCISNRLPNNDPDCLETTVKLDMSGATVLNMYVFNSLT